MKIEKGASGSGAVVCRKTGIVAGDVNKRHYQENELTDRENDPNSWEREEIKYL